MPTQSCSVVQVLVLFHVLHSSAWYAPAHLLPFSQRMHEKAGEGRAALGSQRTVKLASFERAVKVQNPRTTQAGWHEALMQTPVGTIPTINLKTADVSS